VDRSEATRARLTHTANVTRSLTAQTIATGQLTYTFDVIVNGDNLVEADETFFVNVTNVAGAVALDSQAVGTIQNDDPLPKLTLNDISKMGDTLTTFLWLAVLFALSGQLNELGFMSYAGQRLAAGLGGMSWPMTYVSLVVLYVLIHYMFVSQSSQVLALLGVFLDVGIRGGVPAPLMAFALLFASSYFSVITPQGGSQNVIFVASGYLKQSELYRLGGLVTLFFLLVFLTLGTGWIMLVT